MRIESGEMHVEIECGERVGGVVHVGSYSYQRHTCRRWYFFLENPLEEFGTSMESGMIRASSFDRGCLKIDRDSVQE